MRGHRGVLGFSHQSVLQRSRVPNFSVLTQHSESGSVVSTWELSEYKGSDLWSIKPRLHYIAFGADALTTSHPHNKSSSGWI